MVVKDGDSLTVGGQPLKFHVTPGHTPGVVRRKRKKPGGESRHEPGSFFNY